ncbi:aminoglycoside phosphotransferase family protein [Micropruina sonneratiae]|uniref:aminoglycoside phosphotransferase family protein n=1 Tax=Micropruina sonneratiae TaxID=2986940 RepID=UPI00222793FC|nr:aminoglycoside phosphotransferase family protein [Micropruina sp. KQZ13P-5]MCW3158646.1 aminoglycoside phosphotransferase family protein [Micropruina sp. KQZ13P-5]
MTIDRALALMTSAEAGEVLQLALTGDPGVRLPGFRFSLDRVHHRPGADVSAIYQIWYDLPSAESPTEEWLGLTTVAVTEGVATLVHNDLVVRAWRHPADPKLAGLPSACDASVVGGWLGAPVELEMLAYRPLRRAVLAARGRRPAFVKVLRPEKAEPLAQRQRLLHAAGIAPAVIGQPEPGVVISAVAEGQSLAHALVAWPDDPSHLPTPKSLIDLLDALPHEAVRFPRRDSWSDRIDFHAAGAVAVLPDQRDEIQALAAEIAQVLRHAPVGPTVPTHGDYYEANIFTVAARATSVIDVDSVGPGRRDDDLACLLGHVAVLPNLSPDHYARVGEVVEAWRTEFEATVHPASLRARTAAVILSLVSGAETPTALARLDLARAWLVRARQALG